MPTSVTNSIGPLTAYRVMLLLLLSLLLLLLPNLRFQFAHILAATVHICS